MKSTISATTALSMAQQLQSPEVQAAHKAIQEADTVLEPMLAWVLNAPDDINVRQARLLVSGAMTYRYGLTAEFWTEFLANYTQNGPESVQVPQQQATMTSDPQNQPQSHQEAPVATKNKRKAIKRSSPKEVRESRGEYAQLMPVVQALIKEVPHPTLAELNGMLLPHGWDLSAAVLSGVTRCQEHHLAAMASGVKVSEMDIRGLPGLGTLRRLERSLRSLIKSQDVMLRELNRELRESVIDAPPPTQADGSTTIQFTTTPLPPGVTRLGHEKPPLPENFNSREERIQRVGLSRRIRKALRALAGDEAELAPQFHEVGYPMSQGRLRWWRYLSLEKLDSFAAGRGHPNDLPMLNVLHDTLAACDLVAALQASNGQTPRTDSDYGDDSPMPTGTD